MAHAYDTWLEGDLGINERDQRFAEAADELATEWADDAEKCREADEFNDGTFSGEHYSALERAMADLDGYAPEKLIGSQALARLLELAKVHGEARRARLLHMAENELMARECGRKAA
ncbi:hypothetical protein LY625_03895 [Lysobacter sp. GX 14042]|uniref:hypothetical protein n=1 Tax=Lysobacter sp. GX 14042 TaxID=2907155 RepID=UPI001F1732A5|nr:hypothetical protein [Lysobacter sp. GX 14042]MCE7031766.1 hypothetical protein [Lysobacter sp. GX 14042]